MRLHSTVIPLAALALTPVRAKNCRKIKWGPCQEALTALANTTIECGTLPVPLDYTAKKSDDVLMLELVRAPAPKKSKGSIIVNFGGPGALNRQALAGAAVQYAQLVSDEHDLITFDTRGTGNTLPFTCFADDQERARITAQEPDIWNLLTLPTVFSNASDVEVGRRWAAGTAIAERCFNQSKDIGDLLGTAFVARDMFQIVDALGEDGMLRYFGQSYGTALGATAAAMFPDRIDRAVLDGVLNPREYFNTFELELLDSADTAFRAFVEGCVATPENCALIGDAKDKPSADELEKELYQLIYDITDLPLPFNDTLIDYQFLKSGILASLYQQATFPLLATGFASLISGELEAFTAAWTTILSTFAGVANEQLAAIRCSDRIPRLDEFADFLPIVKKKYGLSQILGDLLPALDAVCAQWKFDAKERYEGNFEEETKNPMLIVGNFADALTPLVSAKNVSESFSNSVLLELNGVGHTSFAHGSRCVIQATRAYFINATLPEPGTVCEPNLPLFAPANATDPSVMSA